MQNEAVELRSVTAISGANRLRILLALFVVLLPSLMTWLYLQAFFSASLLDFVPATDDEVLLWHQTATFSAVGFNGGYYTFEEQPAAFTMSHFAAHGPFFPMLYGAIARSLGWHASTGVVFNLVVISLAVLFFILVVRPNPTQLGLLGGLLVTFWVLAYVIPDNSQEAVHLSFGIITAAMLSLLLRPARVTSPITSVALLILILAICLLRPFWVLLLIPLALITTEAQTWRIRIASLLAAVLLTGLVFLISITISAPYPYFLRGLMEAFSISPRTGFEEWWSYLSFNVPAFFGFRDRYLLSVMERYEMLGLIAILLVSVGVAYRASNRKVLRVAAAHKSDLFILYTLGSILVINVLFYIASGYQAFRVFAPYLLMALLILLAEKRYKPVLAVIGVNVLCLPIFVSTFREEKSRNFRFDTAGVQAFADATKSGLVYDAAQNPWCNTILIDGTLFCKDGRCDYVLTIPAGIGISMVLFPQRLSAPLKSKYLLLSEQGKQTIEKQIGAPLQLASIRSTPYGTLYQNQAAACY